LVWWKMQVAAWQQRLLYSSFFSY